MDRLITLNMQNNVLTKQLKVVQNDTGRKLKIIIGDANMDEFTSAKLYAKKPDSTEIYNDCTIITESGKKFIVAPLTSQTLASIGEVKCELQCNGANGYVTSYPFVLEVIKSLVTGSSILSSDEYNALYAILNAANASVVDSMSEMTDHSKTYYLTTTGLVYRWNSTTSAWVQITMNPEDYYTISETDDLLDDKVDKVTGKGLSTNDYDNTEKEKVSSNTLARHTHSNKNLLDTYTQTEENIADAVTKKHSHTNKALLDTYTQTEANLGDAVSKKHTHENKNFLDTLSQAILDAKASAADVDAIEAKIPTQASSSNQLADKNFVNSSIATETSHYISNNGEPFTSVAQLEAYTGTVTNNDYAIVTGIDSQGNTYFDRYKATVSGSTITWAKEYRINNSSFTASQWASINSGITALLTTQIGTNTTNISNLNTAVNSKITNPTNKTSGDYLVYNGSTWDADTFPITSSEVQITEVD